MSGLPPETTQDRTQTKGTTPNPRIEIKISDPAGNRTQATRLEDRESTNQATETDSKFLTQQNSTRKLQGVRDISAILLTVVGDG